MTEAGGDLRPIPETPILLGKEEQVPFRIHPGRVARRLEKEQSGEGVGLRQVQRRMLRHQPGQADRLGADVPPHQLLAARGGVPLVEHQIEHLEDRIEGRRQLRGSGDLERRPDLLDLPLRPHQPLGDRRLFGEIGPGDLRDSEAADDLEA